MPIRVAIGEDSLIVREGLQGLLACDPELQVVATARDLPELEVLCGRERPDVVITDVRMPPTNTIEGIAFAIELQEAEPETGVVVLSQFAEPEYVLALLGKSFARRAYLLQNCLRDRAELPAAVRVVHGGGCLIDPAVVQALARAGTRARGSPLAQLSPRERQVLAAIAEGKSNAAIARSLVLAEAAVIKHISSIFAKLGLHDARDSSTRVKAALTLLSERAGAAREPA